MKDLLKNTPLFNIWQKIKIKHHHGIVVPLFSLKKTEESSIGEFLDLLEIIDFLKEVNFDVLQLLPINDTMTDPSPYSLFSSKALNPIYISLHALKNARKFPKIKKEKRLNYHKVRETKLLWLYDYFLEYFTFIKTSSEYEEFLNKNKWVFFYAKNAAFFEKNLSQINDRENFFIFLQFISFSQMQKVKKYADKNNILLMGDIPLFMSKNSSDFLESPSLFEKNKVVGAPPDFYTRKGQNWNLLPYNWEEMKKNNYKWFKERFSIKENFFHMYRIDHVAGLFRVWKMKENEDPLRGAFDPKDHTLWKERGKKLLKMFISCSNMLPLAEDLGLIPKLIPRTLKELGICSLKFMRREKKNSHFIKNEDYEPLSLTTVTTHDSEPLSLWWEKYPFEAKEFCKFKNWKYEKKLSFEQRYEILKDSHNTASLFHVNPLQEYLAFFDNLVYNPKEERINRPGIISALNWSYRFIPSIKELINNKKLIDIMKALIKNNI